MTHATLFSGIGAAEIAARSLVWANPFNCEIDAFCQQILKYHFPNAEQYSLENPMYFDPLRQLEVDP